MNIIRPEGHYKIPEHAKKVFEGVIFDVYQWEQEMFDGSKMTFEKLKRPDTVVVFPVTDKGNVILTKQRQPGMEVFYTGAGGRVEKGEEILHAAKRELLEETGYEAREFTLWRAIHPVKKIDWCVFVFIAHGLSKAGEMTPDSGEQIELLEVSFEEFLAIAQREDFTDKEIYRDIVEAISDEGKMRSLRTLFRVRMDEANTALEAPLRSIPNKGIPYLQSIVDLFVKLRIYSSAEKVRVSKSENGYAASIVVLIFLFIDSKINELKALEGSNAYYNYDFIKKTKLRSLSDKFREVSVLRDSIAHSYVWDMHIKEEDAQYVFRETLRKEYGTKKFQHCVDGDKTKILKLWINPIKVGGYEVEQMIIFLKDFLEMAHREYSGVHNGYFPSTTELTVHYQREGQESEESMTLESFFQYFSSSKFCTEYAHSDQEVFQ